MPKLEVLKDSFQKAFRHIRAYFVELLLRDGHTTAAGVPDSVDSNIDDISVNDDDICEVKFSATVFLGLEVGQRRHRKIVRKLETLDVERRGAES